MGTPSVALKLIGIDFVGTRMLGDRLLVALLLRSVNISLKVSVIKLLSAE